jgi:LysM repeat protein
MTDDAPDNKPKTPRRRRSSSDASRRRSTPAPPPGEPPVSGGDAADPSAALERLEAMSGGTPAAAPPSGPPPRASRTAVPIAAGVSKSARPRPRPAASSDTGRKIARVAAPAVFLVACIALIAIVFQSGVIGGKTEPVVTPTPSVTQTKSAYKTYKVKAGDSWSGIAVKFNTTTDVLQAANPDLSTTTLVVGERIRVPRQ